MIRSSAVGGLICTHPRCYHVEFRGGVSLHVLRLVSGESVRALLPYSAAFTAGDPVVVPVPRGVVLTAFDA